MMHYMKRKPEREAQMGLDWLTSDIVAMRDMIRDDREDTFMKKQMAKAFPKIHFTEYFAV